MSRLRKTIPPTVKILNGQIDFLFEVSKRDSESQSSLLRYESRQSADVLGLRANHLYIQPPAPFSMQIPFHLYSLRSPDSIQTYHFLVSIFG